MDVAVSPIPLSAMGYILKLLSTQLITPMLDAVPSSSQTTQMRKAVVLDAPRVAPLGTVIEDAAVMERSAYVPVEAVADRYGIKTGSAAEGSEPESVLMAMVNALVATDAASERFIGAVKVPLPSACMMLGCTDAGSHAVQIQLPDPSDLNIPTSPAEVWMFAPPGRIRVVALWVSVKEPSNWHTRRIPAEMVPSPVIEVVPVISMNSPFAAPMSVVVAEATSEPLWFVVRMIAYAARMKSSAVDPIVSVPAGELLEAVAERSAIFVGIAMR